MALEIQDTTSLDVHAKPIFISSVNAPTVSSHNIRIEYKQTTFMKAVGHPLNKTQYQSNLISWVISDAMLEDAFTEVVKSREHDSHYSDIWWLRRNWSMDKKALRDSLLCGTYQLSALVVLGSRDGHRLTRWTALDTVVLKAITFVLTEVVKPVMDQRCHHLKGQEYMNRVEVHQGDHNLIDIGIAKGCPLSPLVGALIFKSLDKMVLPGCAYARYMDDWIFFAKTRWQLRRVIKNMHEVVHGLKLKLAACASVYRFMAARGAGGDFSGCVWRAVATTPAHAGDGTHPAPRHYSRTRGTPARSCRAPPPAWANAALCLQRAPFRTPRQAGPPTSPPPHHRSAPL